MVGVWKEGINWSHLGDKLSQKLLTSIVFRCDHDIVGMLKTEKEREVNTEILTDEKIECLGSSRR